MTGQESKQQDVRDLLLAQVLTEDQEAQAAILLGLDPRERYGNSSAPPSFRTTLLVEALLKRIEALEDQLGRRNRVADYALQRCRNVLALHKELEPIAALASEQLAEYGDTHDLAQAYKKLAHQHRICAEHIEELNKHGEDDGK